jgi:MATE family multidrug resistance protein
VAIGVALVALQAPIARVAFPLVGASEAVTAALATYFGIRIWAAPFTLMNYVILGSTLGRGRTDLGLLLQVGINLVNIVLTLAFVMGLDLGVAGAGLATVIAEAFGVALGLVVIRRLARVLAGALGRAPRPERAAAHARGQPRHHDPHGRAARGFHGVLFRLVAAT